jgi:hypothetical protein
MATAVAVDAARDADRVIVFLEAVRPKGMQYGPIPASFLLRLGVALRLLAWETQGFFFHRQAGLPEARRALQDAFLSLREPNADPTELRATVLRLSLERFAWTGQPDLNADVALSDLNEDAALDAMAEHLWKIRHAEKTYT